jgi:hypothetical protein
MTENRLNIQTILTQRTDKQAECDLLSRQVTIEKEKANPSNFFKFLLAKRTNGTFDFASYTKQNFAKPKELFFQSTDNK